MLRPVYNPFTFPVKTLPARQWPVYLYRVHTHVHTHRSSSTPEEEWRNEARLTRGPLVAQRGGLHPRAGARARPLGSQWGLGAGKLCSRPSENI